MQVVQRICQEDVLLFLSLFRGFAICFFSQALNITGLGARNPPVFLMFKGGHELDVEGTQEPRKPCFIRNLETLFLSKNPSFGMDSDDLTNFFTPHLKADPSPQPHGPFFFVKTHDVVFTTWRPAEEFAHHPHASGGSGIDSRGRSRSGQMSLGCN